MGFANVASINLPPLRTPHPNLEFVPGVDLVTYEKLKSTLGKCQGVREFTMVNRPELSDMYGR
jgi:hypothetical protein